MLFGNQLNARFYNGVRALHVSGDWTPSREEDDRSTSCPAGKPQPPIRTFEFEAELVNGGENNVREREREKRKQVPRIVFS